jgi:hypothetical protein
MNTITATCFIMMCNKQFRRKDPGNWYKKIILLHDNAHPQIANLMKTTLATMCWEIMDHPPYSLNPESPSYIYIQELIFNFSMTVAKETI